jgi:ABC-2 type transport system ATP-binding protein
MSQPALVWSGVERRFGRTVALAGLDLAVEPGSVMGLIGRNGAGKTTALRLAHGILYPDAGRIRVLGLDPATDGVEVRTRVSLLTEESSLYPWMTVEEILGFGAGLHPHWDRELADSLGTRLDLDPSARISTLSRGTRAKVALVLAVACRPRLLLLDDPTAGLDPLVRREVLEGVLDAVPSEGGSVVYASHLVHDVERVADHVAVLDRGHLRLQGALDGIKDRIRKVTAVFEGGAPETVSLPGKIDARAEGRVLTVVAERVNGDLHTSLRKLGARQVEVEPISLEEILVACLRQGGDREAEVEHA